MRTLSGPIRTLKTMLLVKTLSYHAEDEEFLGGEGAEWALVSSSHNMLNSRVHVGASNLTELETTLLRLALGPKLATAIMMRTLHALAKGLREIFLSPYVYVNNRFSRVYRVKM